MSIALGENPDAAMTTVGNGLTDAQTETCALHIVIQLHKALEDLVLIFLRNAGTRIFAVDIKSLFPNALLLPITNLDMPLLSILHGIGHEVGDDLLYSTVVELGHKRCQWIFLHKGHIGILHALGK